MSTTYPLVMGIDPGTTQSAYVLLDANDTAAPVKEAWYGDNRDLLSHISLQGSGVLVACETIRPMQFITEEILMTREWVGRFRQRALDTGHSYQSLERQRSILKVLLGTSRGGDKEVRAKLLAIYGKERAKGCAGHKWSALAVAHVAAFFSVQPTTQNATP